MQAGQAGGGGGGTTTTTTTTTAPVQPQQQQALVINHQGQLISLPVLQATQQQLQTPTGINTRTTNANSCPHQQTVNLSHIN